MNEKEKEEVIIDGENEAGSISPSTESNSSAKFKSIDSVDVDEGTNGEDVISNKVDESKVELVEVKEGEIKDIVESKDGIKESDVENETNVIPADRDESKTEMTTTTVKEEVTEENNSSNDNLPLISVGIIAAVLVIAFIVAKVKSSKNKGKE